MGDAFSERFQDSGAAAVPVRALVPLTTPSPDDRTEGRQPIRPDARFVVQLIASATHAPQARLLRRAEPADAATSYSGALGRRGIRNGAAFSQVA